MVALRIVFVRARHVFLFCITAILFAGLSGTAAIGQSGDNTKSFYGCWVTVEPTGITFLSKVEEPDYKSFVQSMMLRIEPFSDKEAFGYLVKGGFDIWSESDNFYIPTQYFNGAYDPVDKSLIVGAPKQGNSTIRHDGERIYYIHHKSTETASDMSVRMLEAIDCSEMLSRRKAIQERFPVLSGG